MTDPCPHCTQARRGCWVCTEGGGIRWDLINHGTCPKCGEFKFIGHGPLCIDCFTKNPGDA
jgi:hypothetical protein